MAPDGLIKGPVRDLLLCFSVIKQRISLQPNWPAVQALNTFHYFVSMHVVCAELAEKSLCFILKKITQSIIKLITLICFDFPLCRGAPE